MPKTTNTTKKQKKPNNGNEIKSDIFPWDTFKSDVVFVLINKY